MAGGALGVAATGGLAAAYHPIQPRTVAGIPPIQPRTACSQSRKLWLIPRCSGAEAIHEMRFQG